MASPETTVYALQPLIPRTGLTRSQQHSQNPYGYSHQGQNTGQYQQQPGYQGQQPHGYQNQGRPPKEDKIGGFLGKIQGAVTDLGTEMAQKLGNTIDPQAYAQYGAANPTAEHRFGSFAPPREHNDVKWYVDGCSYFWAVSRALENARESIWILDCEYRFILSHINYVSLV